MWKRIAAFILKYRLTLLLLMAAVVIYAAFQASKVELSYEYTRAIPTDNPKYQAYQNFLKKFGDDGNLLVIGVETDSLFNKDVFNDFQQMSRDLKKIKGVEQVLSIPDAIILNKNKTQKNLKPGRYLRGPSHRRIHWIAPGKLLKTCYFIVACFYNPDTHAYLMAISVNKQIMNSAGRTAVVQ